VMMLSTDQPLIIALPNPLKLLANCLPLPKGRSYTTLTTPTLRTS